MKRFFGLLLLISSLSLSACQDTKQASAPAAAQKLQIVTTLFPLYDFARSIGGDKVEVTLLLPPGVEAHAFEPRPEDAMKTTKAGLFIYTNKYMEPWADKFVSGLGASGLTVVDASKGVALQPAAAHKHHDKAHQHGHNHAEQGKKNHRHDHGHAVDPHIWLDLDNARIMVDTIAQAMTTKDPANAAAYTANAAALKQKLTQLDADYKSGLASCNTRTFLHGGHYAFGYLAKRYNLQYESAVSVNADAEPTPARMIELIKQVKKSGVKYIFSEEMVSPRLTEAIAREAGVKVLSLHNLHNISKDDLQAGIDYLTLMRRNLEQLKTGLGCRQAALTH